MSKHAQNISGRRAVFLIEQLSCVTILLAFILRCFGIKACYARHSRFVENWGLHGFFERVGITQLDFGALEALHGEYWLADSYNMIPLALKDLLGNQKLFDAYADAYCPSTYMSDALKSALFSQAGRRYHIVFHFLLWLRSVQWHPFFIIAYVYKDCFTKLYMQQFGVPVINLAPPMVLVFLWGKLLGSICHLLRTLPKKCLKYTRKINAAQTNTCTNRNIKSVIFFPHQSIFYGNLFVKDHFYSEDKNSPLYKENILHIEFNKNTIAKDAIIKQQAMNLETYIMKRLGIKCILCNFFSFVLFVCRQCLRIYRLGGLSFSQMSFFCGLYIEAQHYIKELSSLGTDVKIALIGYDMLLPPGLAIALKFKNIKTVAVQERLYPVFQGWFYSIRIDYYFVASNFVCQQIERMPNFTISKALPVGLVRTDLLYKYAATKDERLDRIKEDYVLISALDFHSQEHGYEQCLNVDINWASNRQFYLDMIRLALMYPQLYIIIRGKNALWLDIKYFYPTAQLIEFLPNIEVNTEYEKVDVSYKLCSKSDIIVARHTSLADECLAVGKQVLIHDYTHNSRSLLSASFDYFGAPFFCHSFEELRCGVQRYLDTGCVMDPKQYEAIRSRVFEGRADGKVRQRVQQVILDILQGDSAPGSADA